jgi:hypothetical protein
VIGEWQRGKGLVFIGGSPRSGTTLVQNVMDSHPEICGGPEFDRIPEIVRLRNKLRASVDSGRIRVFCSREDVDRETALFIGRLLSPYAEERGCKVISEKTPWNVLVFQDLLEICPEARFIFCVRDPRAVVASLLQVGARAKAKGVNSPPFTRSVSAAIKTIKTTNGAGFGAVNRSDRVLPVVYERVVASPERETKRICSFLRMPWSEEMLRPGEKDHDGEKVLDNVWYDPKMYGSNFDPSRADKWKSQLSLSDRAAIVTLFESDENLKDLGYDLADEGLSATRRVAVEIRIGSLAALERIILRIVSHPVIGQLGAKLMSWVRVARRRA